MTITLPVKWVNKFHLKKGDELDVEERSDQLVVTARKQLALDKKIIDYKEFGKFRKNDLSHAYLLGYDDVEIIFEDEQTLDEVRRAVPECIGFEIINQKPKRVYIRSIANALEKDFDMLLRKAFQVTNEMAKEVFLAVKANKYRALTELRHLEAINNKFTLCCARILVKEGYKNQSRTLQMYELVKNLERIGDRYKYICDALSSYDKKLPKKMIDYFEDVNQYYLNFYELFYRFDPKLKERIYIKKELVKRGEDLFKKATMQEIRVLNHLMDVVTLTYDIASNYFAVIL